jgi:hypothetical protein
MLKIGWKNCPYCGDHEVYRSRSQPLTRIDRMCVFLLLQVVRCYECEERHYRPVFFPVQEPPYPIRLQSVQQTPPQAETRSRAARAGRS